MLGKLFSPENMKIAWVYTKIGVEYALRMYVSAKMEKGVKQVINKNK